MSILTINKDGTPSYNEVNYVLHELVDSRIKRHTLSGIITDMEVSDIGAKIPIVVFVVKTSLC